MSVLVEFAMFPTDKGTSVSTYVSRIIKMIDESGTNYQLTPMGTIFETSNMDDALKIISKAHECLSDDCDRIYSTVKFDIQKTKENRIKTKVQSIENKIGTVKK
jgi:uncharacterized protein (TIGR00106 family)